ncbi:ankyrin, partial [Trichoderma citrinoviride]
MTPLSQAARNNHAGVVRTLLRHNASVETRHRWDRTVIHHVAGQGHAEMARILVEEGNVDIEAKDEDGFTTLYFGCIWGHHDVVKLMLDLGADPHMGIKMDDPPEKWSPLVAAIDDGYEKCVMLLLEKGANPNLPGPKNQSALYMATRDGESDLAELLVEKGANVNEVTTDNLTPLYYAVPNSDIVKILVEKGADPNRSKKGGFTCLMYAAWFNHSETAELLLEHGADIE